jgi:hypothetical protein
MEAAAATSRDNPSAIQMPAMAAMTYFMMRSVRG